MVTHSTATKFDGESAGRALRTPGWAANYLGLTTSWLARLRMSGAGPRYTKLTRRIFYRRDDLDAWVNQRLISNTSQKTAARCQGIDG